MQTGGFCVVFNNVFLGEFAGKEKKNKPKQKAPKQTKKPQQQERKTQQDVKQVWL